MTSSRLLRLSPVLLLLACADEWAESAALESADSAPIPLEDGAGWSAGAKADADADGYASTVDCDDTNAAINPGATESDNLTDDDCDKYVDETFVAVGDIIVTEINKRSIIGGAGVVNNASWVEIYNDSSRTVDLAYWTFARGTSSFANQIKFDPATAPVIAAGDYAVICDTNDYEGSSVSYPLTCDYVWGDEAQAATYKSTYHDNTFYLRRDSDAASLYINGTRTTGTLVDRATYSTGYPNKTRFSLSLDPASHDSVSNDSAASFCATTASSTGTTTNDSTYRWYDVTTTSSDEYGTPGAANYDCPLDADADGYDTYGTDADCDDGNAAVNPGATETCNSIDDDCDGLIDESGSTTYYADADSDSYGDLATSQTACTQPTGYVTDSTDCDDTNAAVNPGATESCNGIDDDCDSLIDESGTSTTWYADVDLDTYGDTSTSTVSCAQPSGYVADGTDCNDADGTINPGELEVCNDLADNDCVASSDCEASGSQEIKATGSLWHYDFRGYGTAANYAVGASVADNGDLNGDGYDDVVVGQIYHDNGTTIDVGRVLVWYGATDMSSETIDTTDLAIEGSTSQASDYHGSGVRFAGDVDGDLQDDLLTAANYAGSTNTGAAYLFYGGTAATSVSSADATFTGAATNNYMGQAMDGADIDGDSLSDIAVGAYGTSSSAGAVSLWNATGVGGAETPSTSTALITGATAGDTLGYALTMGDLTGDGMAELILGAPAASSTTATSRVYIFSSAAALSGTVSASTADAALTSSAGGDRLGLSLGFLGDSDGDGTNEFLAGADKNDTAATDAGAVYVISGVPASGTAAAAADTVVQGSTASDFFGRTVAGIGDLNGDSYADLMFGATGYDVGALSGAGSVYLFYGPMATGTVAAATYDAQFTGANSSDAVGLAIAGGGDVNADGYDDWMSGATSWDGFGYSNSGGSWMFFGTGE